MLTANTITDEQIRELRDGAYRNDKATYFVAACALGTNPYTAVGLDDDDLRGCRARCAEILNVRAGR